MDDLILRAALWQDEHWVDRSGMLKGRSIGWRIEQSSGLLLDDA